MNALPPHSDRDSIFRGKQDPNGVFSQPSSHNNRFHHNNDRVSWEVDEHPFIPYSPGVPLAPKNRKRHIDEIPQTKEDQQQQQQDTGKMKYRCKLCGQIKQNHECPYQKSMQRSIGVMVYPAVNAFSSKEPGDCAAPLSDMNNFVSYESDEQVEVTESPKAVTPVVPASPKARKLSPESTDKERANQPNLSGGRSFVDSITVRPEQFRAVTPLKGLYRYMSIPLTFTERKRLSDTLFVMSQQVPAMVEEVSTLLHNAREAQEWDLAVAEILTQVVVALHCDEEDKQLDGLQQYLLNHGVSC
mmetsp:Transcript_6017/g.10522  ORF Transcript_6017/g.10522 Transcript_6017/m.10522 type:complete len:301 (-) Transcript_6017:137-1039(-)